MIVGWSFDRAPVRRKDDEPPPVFEPPSGVGRGISVECVFIHQYYIANKRHRVPVAVSNGGFMLNCTSMWPEPPNTQERRMPDDENSGNCPGFHCNRLKNDRQLSNGLD